MGELCIRGYCHVVLPREPATGSRGMAIYSITEIIFATAEFAQDILSLLSYLSIVRNSSFVVCVHVLKPHSLPCLVDGNVFSTYNLYT